MNDTPRPSFGERLIGAFLVLMRALAKALLVVLVLGGLAAGVYFGVPYLYRTYVQPVEETQAAVAAFQTQTTDRLNDLEQQVAALKRANAQLQGRVDALEEQQAQDQADLEALQAVVEGHTQALTTLDDLQTQLDEIEGRLDEVAAALAATQGDTQALADQVAALQVPVAEVHRNLNTLQAMEHLTRARLFLIQANYGLAKEEVQSAAAIVAALAAEAPADEADVYAELEQRLNQAASRLPSLPVIAAEDLEAAWHLLGGLLPTPVGTTPTPTAEAQNTPTPTPTP